MAEQGLMNILIVDDSALNIQAVENVLGREGYRLSAAASGAAALTIAFGETQDLVLLDIVMPGMDGYEVCKRLRADPRTADLPVIFLTSKSDKNSIIKAFEMGGVDYITKPFNYQELVARVATHLNLRAARKRLETANQDLRRSHGRLQSFLQNVDDLVCFRDLRGQPTLVNPAFTRLIGITTTRLKMDSNCWHRLVHEDDLEGMHRFFDRHPQGARHFEIEYRIHRPGAGWHWLHARMVGIPDGRGGFGGYHCIERDITSRKQGEERKLQRLTLMFDSANEAMMISDVSGNIVNVNRAFGDMTGYKRSDVEGRNQRILCSDKHHEAFYAELWESVRRNGFWQGELWNKGKDGRLFPARQSVVAERDEAGRIVHFVSVFSDITKEKASEERIRKLAFFDSLTGLPNRMQFGKKLGEAVRRAEQQETNGGLLILGLDRFSQINESLGHAVGDGLLIEAARRVAAAIPEGALAARLGGDEFGVMLETLADKQALARLAQALVQEFRSPVSGFGNVLVVTVSAGLCHFPADGAKAESLLKNAETAMGRAKANGRDGWEAYSVDLTSSVLEELLLESNLRRAFDQGLLCVHYQPQFDLATRQVIGAEALLRWIKPDGSMVSPGTFIPVAERTGQIAAIGEWVLQDACEFIARLRDEHGFFGRIAVNLSGVQFRRSGVVAMVRNALEKTGVEGRFLELEITESVILSDPHRVVKIIQALKQQGVEVALDDFGTGYSSLSHLKTLPVDKLKIDQSFVADLERDPGDRAIIQTIIALGKNLHLKTIAEGIETEGQAAFLLQHGCDQGQGYLQGKAMPAEDFIAVLKGPGARPGPYPGNGAGA